MPTRTQRKRGLDMERELLPLKVSFDPSPPTPQKKHTVFVCELSLPQQLHSHVLMLVTLARTFHSHLLCRLVPLP